MEGQVTKNVSDNLYPFRDKVILGGFFYLRAVSESNFFIGGFYSDSFVGKNYDDRYSALVKRQQVFGLYECRLPWKHTGVGGEGHLINYDGLASNKKKEGSLWCSIGVPALSGHFITKYRYDNNAFDKVVSNYNSYSWEKTHKLYLSWYKEWIPYAIFEITYLHYWRETKNLINEATIVFCLWTSPLYISFAQK